MLIFMQFWAKSFTFIELRVGVQIKYSLQQFLRCEPIFLASLYDCLSVYLSLYPPLLLLGNVSVNTFPRQTKKHTAIEELDSSFSMQSVSYEWAVCLCIYPNAA
jgi:hypothetical protein